MNNPFKPASAYFSSSSQELPASVLYKIKQLNALEKKIAAYLNPNIRPFCQVANLDGSRLVILIANAAIATQLRYQIPELLTKFKQDKLLQRITQIEHKIRLPLYTPKARPTQPMAPLSAKSAAILNEMIQSLKDPKLKAVMEKISKHVQK